MPKRKNARSGKARTASVDYEALESSSVPWSELFEVEQRTDWGAVAGEIGALRCIRFAGLRDGDAEYVKRSAVHELGRRNVYVDVVARSESPPLNDVFIIPRALVANLLLEAGRARRYGDLPGYGDMTMGK